MFVAVACVVNIVGDLLLVAVFHMDAAGAALATVLAQAIIERERERERKKKKKKRNKKKKKKIFFLFVFCVILFALFLFEGDVLSSLFTTDPDVIQNGFDYLKGFAAETILTAVLFSMIGYFNGHNNTVWVMAQGLIQTLIVRLPMSYIMSMQA